MIHMGKFRCSNGHFAKDRIDAAKAYLKTDWVAMRRERWSSPGFDPEHPLIEKQHPDWRSDPKIASDLSLYIQLKDAADDQMKLIKSGPDNEYTRAENALLMCQRVDLWCAGEKEVEHAVRHLYMLGMKFNQIDHKKPLYVTEFYPGSSDF